MTALPSSSETPVSGSYNEKIIFITGGTGFIGKVLLEKLLRDCPGISRIYLLVRPKWNQDASFRLQKLLKQPVFNILREQQPGQLNKVFLIEGDISLPDLGISSSQINELVNSVNIVFNSAATVRFDEKLKQAVTVNLVATQRLAQICKQMRHLEALVHVSTFYSNCDQKIIKEIVYPPPMPSDLVASLVEMLDENIIDTITPSLLGEMPNTYTFTKVLAEDWLKNNRENLPVVIVRPSVILSTWREPVPGWVDNKMGPTGMVIATAKGWLRVLPFDDEKVAHFVPVDMVANFMIVAAWKISKDRSEDIPVYNLSSGGHTSVTWGRFLGFCAEISKNYIICENVFEPTLMLTVAYNLQYVIHKLFLEMILVYLADTFFKTDEARRLKIQNKLYKEIYLCQYFTTHDWIFEDDNVKNLFVSLTPEDKDKFYFDVTQVNWDEFIENYVHGISRFLMKQEERKSNLHEID